MHRISTFLCLLLIISFINIAVSQNSLKEFSARRAIQWKAERAYAESVATANNMPIRYEFETGRIIEIQKFYDGRPYYYTTCNLNAARTISTTKVYPAYALGYSLTGAGITLGQWDGGRVRVTHQEFGGRVTANQGSTSDHATHVAGTMIAGGISVYAKGMSFQGLLNSYDWNNDETEMASQAAGGLQVSNHSYAYITGWDYNTRGDGRWYWAGDTSFSQTEDNKFGFYDSHAKNWDLISRNAPNYLIVVAASNDRGEGPSGTVEHWIWTNSGWALVTRSRNKDGNASGYDCLSSPAMAKNLLTVGAVDDITGGYGGPGSVVMSSFSSWGPTDDGRIKPDIVANGIGLYSSVASADNAYGVSSGTSMATPNVSGSIGLILEHQKNQTGNSTIRSATLKALIINTADEAGSYDGPDYKFGWGLMNTFSAVDLMHKDSVNGFNTHIYELQLDQNDTIKINIGSDGLEPLKASICWTDVPGTSPPWSLNPTTRMLVNDLDLRIIRKRDNVTFSPWILNPASPAMAATTGDNICDNVEQVYLASPERTSYIVQITHKGTLSGLTQDVSLVISGNIKNLGPVFTTAQDTFEYTHVPEGLMHDSLAIRNNGDSALVVKIGIPDSATAWLSSDEDSLAIDPLDSTFIHFVIERDNLIPWNKYTATINFNCNDSAETPYPITIIHNTLGPTLTAIPNHISIDLDTNQSKTDSIMIRNDGYITLHFSIIDTGSAIPDWLTLYIDTGTVAVGDSIYIPYTLNDAAQDIGDYYTVLKIESNDYQSGLVGIPIALHIGTNRTLAVNVNNQWNIISLPVISDINLKTLLYPTAISEAYAHEGMYAAKDTLLAGIGYWLKFEEPESITFHGYVFSNDTVAVHEGWNLIGTISNTISASNITSFPPDIISSFFFGFDNGYIIADSLRAGKGYWIQVSGEGSLFLNGEFPTQFKVTPDLVLSSLSSITIIDNQGNKQVLYFGTKMIPGTEKSMLPPQSPGDFDARYDDGTMIKICPVGENEYTITVKSTSPDLTLQWNIQPSDAEIFGIHSENKLPLQLSGKGAIRIGSNPSGNTKLKLVASSKNTPKEFALHQNYPNPFNPTTKIEFDMPVSGLVAIKLYNILGSEITTLLNGFQEAGYHAITFDAANLPTGIYFYKMVSDKFSAVRKLVLTK